MRKLHIEYLRCMASAVTYFGAQPFQAVMPDAAGNFPLEQGRFLEIEPPLDKFRELAPFCVVTAPRIKNTRDGKPFRRIANGVNGSIGPLAGRATQRLLKREYAQVFSYQLDFWLEDPAQDLMSDPRIPGGTDAMSLDPDGPGIADQCLLYISKNRHFTDGHVPIWVDAGPTTIMSDPARQFGLYKIVVGVDFHDGLYSVEENSTLDGATIGVMNTAL